MAKKVTFFYVSGRGWVLSSLEHCCPYCGHHFGKAVERVATDVEFALAIKPALEKVPAATSVDVEIGD